MLSINTAMPYRLIELSKSDCTDPSQIDVDSLDDKVQVLLSGIHGASYER